MSNSSTENQQTSVSGVKLISKERREQLEKHGVTLLLDSNNNKNNQLAKAAQLLLYTDEMFKEYHLKTGFEQFAPSGWDRDRFDYMMRKPYKERLIIAGALIAAELDRINNFDNWEMQRFVIQEIDGKKVVYDTQTKVAMTDPGTPENILQEICGDFNALDETLKMFDFKKP